MEMMQIDPFMYPFDFGLIYKLPIQIIDFYKGGKLGYYSIDFEKHCSRCGIGIKHHQFVIKKIRCSYCTQIETY